MNEYLSNHFKSDLERIQFHIYGQKEFEPKVSFIIGLDGMFCEKAIIKGQEELGHFYSPLNQTTNHWTTNFNKTDENFKKLWTDEEWKELLEYENQFIKIHKFHTKWKYKQPKAPKLFELETYKELKRYTVQLFESLSKSDQTNAILNGTIKMIQLTLQVWTFSNKEISELKHEFEEEFNIELERDYENDWEWIWNGPEVKNKINISREHNWKTGEFSKPLRINISWQNNNSLSEQKMIEKLQKILKSDLYLGEISNRGIDLEDYKVTKTIKYET